MWDVRWFDNKYHFATFDKSNLRNLVKDLELDFKLDLEGVRGFKAIQQLVFNSLQKISWMGNVSRGRLDCSFVWKILFTNVFVEKVPNKDKSFFDLYYFFDDRQKWYRETEERINTQRSQKDISEYLVYMGLSENFTAKELKRRYRILCLKYHPDKPTGSAEEFNKLQDIRMELEKRIY